MVIIQTFNAISAKGLAQFPANAYQISDNAALPDAILLRSHALQPGEIKSSVKAIARCGAGVNTIPVDWLTRQGVPVFNTPGANANAVKEWVIAGMLLASRNLCQGWQYTKQLVDQTNLNETIEQQKKMFVGTELPGRTLAVIGLGAVGVKVANTALALGMNVIGYDPTISVQRAWELSSGVQKAETLTAALTGSHFVSLHVPLTAETQGFLQAEHLRLCDADCILINSARGDLVNEEAVRDALENHTLRCYVTDFPSASLKDHPKVIALPHLGASTTEAEDNCAVMAAHSLMAFLEHGEIHSSVNFPEVTFASNQGYRISICNDNIPNMLGQISSLLAKAQLNILDMINKSRNDVAYTLIDVEQKIPPQVFSDLKHIKGVLRVYDLSRG